MRPIEQAAPFAKANWAPTQYRPRLAQAVTASPMSPPAAARPPFIDSALVNFLIAGAGAVSTGFLAYGASTVNKARGIPGTNSWAFIYGIASGLLSLKALVDLTDIRTR